MPLSAGDKLGPYDIVAPIGAGGMGRVWKARDTRLGRTVAIKVSAAEFSERFEREARTIAAVNHPHICQLYDVGPNYLVMELIDGKQLAGPLPVDRALEYAMQIAEALDAAHRKGVVHRDLKPANIMVAKTGVKLLDFGLAKTSGSAEAAAAGETKTIALTKEHTILGTLQYMAPEQLEAKEAEARSDIFAFGAVFYEMLTGRKAFEGASQASVISQIMSREPPSVSNVASPAVDHILRRCLAKDPSDRWQTARDLALELRWLREGGAPNANAASHQRSKVRERLTWAGIVVSTATALAFGFLLLNQPKPVPAPVRFTVNTPENGSLPLLGRPSVSPNGQWIAFAVADPASRKPVWYLHSLSSGTSRVLRGTEDATAVFWSFDSRSLLLLRGGAAWKMDLAGGDAQRLPVQNVAYSSWQREGIVSGGAAAGLIWFRPDGSDFRLLKKAGGKDGGYRYPSLIPGGRWLLYNAGLGGPPGLSLHIASLWNRATCCLCAETS
jgi:serine/threonine protein kinase